jgi:CMP-N-acetylneuraminic acid synthetase
MEHQAQRNIAVIPARGGSLRLPGKNIRPLAGQPVIAYTIGAALNSELFARVIVTTDDERIADVAVRYGAEVPFLRDASLADDHTPVSAATVDVLERLDPFSSHFSVVAQLLPNCPLRDADDVRDSYQQFITTGARAQLSVAQYGWQPAWWAMKRTPDLRLVPLFPAEAVRRSQDLAPLFCPSGAIWWARADTLREARTFHQAGRTGWAIQLSHAIDIDTEEDWLLAELLMQHRLAGASHGG